MEFTRELLTKAKETKTIEELLALAKENGVEMSAEEAEKLCAKFHQSGELADEELDNVSGGGCLSPYGDSCPVCGNTRIVMKYRQETESSPIRQAWCCAGCGEFVCWRL